MKLISKQLVFSLAAATVFGCAKISSPTGGPKDTEPPVPLRSSPVNYSTNFKGKKFVVEFDEFVDLKNVSQELLVSPPVPNRPKVVMRGKKMVVRINNELADSTTYNFNFFNSVADLNEGNILPNFQFEFSTGDSFDSTYCGGQITDAFTCQPLKDVKILLYRQFADSTPRTQKPECIGRTNADGFFIVPNMKAEPYYVFALRDLNNNNLFDMPNEAIAFCDSTIQPSFRPVTMYDTITLIERISRDRKDTVFRDSIHAYTQMVTTLDDMQLHLFTEEFHIQYLHDVYRPGKRTLAVAFNDLVDSTFSIKPVTDSAYADNWCLIESPLPTDSVVLWITDSALYKRDTLLMQVCYTMKDSNNADYLQVDTLEFISKTNKAVAKKEKKGGRLASIFKKDEEPEEKKEEKKVSELKADLSISKQVDIVGPIALKTNYPVTDFKPENITVTRIEEDKETAVKFTMERQPDSWRRFNIDFKRDESMQYRILIPAGTLTDVYGNINDTVRQEFKTQSQDYYSSVLLNISGTPCAHSIVQLLDGKENVLKEYTIDGDTKLTIDYLAPGKYGFKLICDENQNGRWDTGNFSERRQPERVFYFNQTVETKSGWDIEYTWIVE